jgi:F-type H+-transporting ATPase subunit b
MRVPGSDRQRKGIKIISWAKIFAITALLVFSFSTTAAASGGEQGSKGWVKTDWYRVLNFAVLAAGLVFLLRKPLSQALRSRIAGIKEQLEDLESQKAAAEKKLVEYNQKLSDLEKEAERIVAEYINQGNEAKARILKEAAAATEKLQTQARRSIEHEFEQAKQQLQAEILEKSLAKAEEIIKEKISADDQNRLVDEYLEKVEA